ncbi:MAG: DUF6516 family protein [Desulfobacterales bacterium]
MRGSSTANGGIGDITEIIEAQGNRNRQFFFTLYIPYGIKHHMKSRLIYREKFIYSDGSIREMVLWQLSKETSDRPHRLKYRLYYGLKDGTCIVRYDNEAGKGDHKHFKGIERTYRFTDVETLVADFLEDIEKARSAKI